MINWDAPCRELNCEHLYYVYGCEPNCALKCSCDKIKEYEEARDELHRKERCYGCDCYETGALCHICSRNYSDMYST